MTMMAFSSTNSIYNVPAGVVTNNVPVPYIPDHIELKAGKARTITMPDGTIIDFKRDGSFSINDANSKVIYKAVRVHDFNTFINASDRLEEFIRFCGSVGVRKGEMLGIPIEHFIKWLVIEAAKADGEDVVPLLLPDLTKPRCRSCGRWMSPRLKADRIEFCRSKCLEVKLNSHRRDQNGYKGKTRSKGSTGASRTTTAAGSVA
jgi:hypothetical protein